MTALFTAKATAKGGRSGHVTSDDGILDYDLVMPNEKKEGETGTNPEQLFAAGYAACFGGALELVAKKQGIDLESEVEGRVSLIKDESDGGFKIGVQLVVSASGLEKEKAEELVKAAHEFCPYSKATRGNIDVDLHSLLSEKANRRLFAFRIHHSKGAPHEIYEMDDYDDRSSCVRHVCRLYRRRAGKRPTAAG